jgi:hypothetical protein
MGLLKAFKIRAQSSVVEQVYEDTGLFWELPFGFSGTTFKFLVPKH